MTERRTKDDDDPELSAYLAALGARVRDARAKRGMARRILARDSGVSERYLAQLESGAGNPSVAVLRQIARAVDYPLADLVAGPGAASPALAPLVDLLSGVDPARLPMIESLIERHLAGGGAGATSRKRISLIGLRGAGKSTLGRLLAERLTLPFVELNRLVEQDYGGSIGEILALSGQPAFRRYERRALESVVAQHERAVISTGGGLVSESGTFGYLLEHCWTVWIKASPEEHMTRVIEQGDLRPMARNDEAMDDLKAILAAREPSYRRADASVDTTGQSVEESLSALMEAVRPVLQDEAAA
ncbi:MAG: helix-turn-helix transcriptional regulator [Marivibrio sp.]|uniref:helix-turn-helix transcriptional regulator n=1 Tax=Marivibrio sp. TaxID=2039719 RepID=UPI0032EB80F8